MKRFLRHRSIIITEDYDALPDSLWRGLCFLLRRGYAAEAGLSRRCVIGAIEALERRYPGQQLTADQVVEWMPLDRLFALYNDDDPPGIRTASPLGRYLARLPGTDVCHPLSRPPCRQALRAHRNITGSFLLTAIRLTLHHRYKPL
ncbi:hypothetical protein QMZ65_23030 [Pantoea sp. EABMAA-21]|uniref:hypothetical protein n=1 Tax=Pantoea sp. EABMAA-21 TaxID=3043302 RepID=UPI0024B5CC54|nr:hypothetical protein [Pantoea sp. EABMAA-21]MDI9280096.1 hypothetical protein [Pantoea sp. EABMAA-21]